MNYIEELFSRQGALLRAAAQWAENGMPQGGNEGGYQS